MKKKGIFGLVLCGAVLVCAVGAILFFGRPDAMAAGTEPGDEITGLSQTGTEQSAQLSQAVQQLRLGDGKLTPVTAVQPAEGRQEVQDDRYLYEFDENQILMTAVALDGGKVVCEKTDEAGIQAFCRDFAVRALPGFGKDCGYDVQCTPCQAGGSPAYSVELWEKLMDSCYSGNKIAMMVTEDGRLISYSYHQEAESEIRQEMVQAAKASLTEKEAIEAAYAALPEALAKWDAENRAAETSPAKTADGTKEVVLPETQASYAFSLADREKHQVTASQQVADGKPCWIVEIYGIALEPDWTIGVFLTLDATTGALLRMDTTR